MTWGWDFSTINPTNFGRGLDSQGKIEWDRLPTDPRKNKLLELLYIDTLVFSGSVRSVGPVGDFLECWIQRFVSEIGVTDETQHLVATYQNKKCRKQHGDICPYQLVQEFFYKHDLLV